MQQNELRLLIDKYLAGKCTLEEQGKVEAWIEKYNEPKNNWTNFSELEKEDWLNSLYQNISQKISPAEAVETATPILPLFNRLWLKVASVAAVIMILLFSAIWFNSNTLENKLSELPVKENKLIDVLPGGDRAILQLADGTQIVLDSSANGAIANQGNTKIIKLNGKLAYNASNLSSKTLYNTITTPKGGQYQIELADGSKVWLNAASSLRFPTVFNESERSVELIGEAYFEIKKNASKPFKVNVNGKEEVEVLGTHFNVNGYEDEPSINTTLLEGKVKVLDIRNDEAKKNSAVYLSPGQQAKLKKDFSVNYNVDMDAVIAWKNGSFIFNSADIQNVLRQVSRWYNLNVVFNGPISKETFSGIVSRNSNLSQVLKIMEQAGVKFKIDGKNIYVE